MNNNILVDDYVLVESLIKISYAIENLYHKLYMLEIKNLKESEEYKKYLEYLDMSLEYEEELYNESNLTALKCQNLIHLIINRYINKKMINDLESVLSRKYENAYFRRVVNKLNAIMKNDYSGMEELIDNDIFEIKDNIDYDYMYLSNLIRLNLMNDYIERIFLILQEKIDEEKDIKLKNKLIRDKYYISFIFPNAEKKLMNNNFSVENRVCDITIIISYILGITEDEYKEIHNDYLEKEIRKLFYKTMFKEKEEKVSKEKLILRECLIRALFMMANKKMIDELCKEFKSVSKINCDNIEVFFKNCVTFNNKDKQKQITIKIW